jgi:hypothetical protein
MVALLVVAEALGLRWGLQTNMDPNLSHVLVQLDASQVVDCFNGELSLASIDSFILDCKELLINLVDIYVSLIKRNCNEAAHQLAQVAKTVESHTLIVMCNCVLEIFLFFLPCICMFQLELTETVLRLLF